MREVLPPFEDYPRAPVFLVLIALVKEMVFVAESVFTENYAARRELAVVQPLTSLRLKDELFVGAVRGCVPSVEGCLLSRQKQSLLQECLSEFLPLFSGGISIVLVAGRGLSGSHQLLAV